MRILPIILFLAFPAARAVSQEQPGWKLVFHDEFDSAALNRDKWMDAYPWGRSICSTGELCYYSPGANYGFADGALTLYTRKESIRAKAIEYEADDKALCDNRPNLRTFEYTSGMIYSKQEFLYGYFEIRFRVSKGRGLWPAFWLYGSDSDEIDVFELFGDELDKIGTNIHYQGECMCHGRDIQLKNGKMLSRQFNVMAVEWKPGLVIWFLNGDTIRIQAHDFTRPMHVIANTSVDWKVGGQSKRKLRKMFPAAFEIDYIRVYQRDFPKGRQVGLHSIKAKWTPAKVLIGKSGNGLHKRAMAPPKGTLPVVRKMAGKKHQQ